MSTRSNIGIIHEDNTVSFIYCHSDGYVDYNGKMLFKHYQNLDKIYSLIELGDISSLGIEIGSKHDFDNCPENETNVYGRDRGETDTPPILVENKEIAKSNMQEYMYLFNIKSSRWIVSDHGDQFVDLETEIVRQKEQTEE